MRNLMYRDCRTLVLCTLFSLPVARAELYFPPSLVSEEQAGVADLSRFNLTDAQLPGEYQVDIWVNGENAGSRTLAFNVSEMEKENVRDLYIHDKTGLTPCLSAKMLAGLGMKPAFLTPERIQHQGECLIPGKLVTDAFTEFDFQNMRLNISIPQVAMDKRAPGWVSEDEWDQGITAALLNYNASGSENRTDYGTSRNLYLTMTSGFNWGAWRLRDQSSYTWYQTPGRNQRQQQHLLTYAERTLIPWRSQLTMGDSTTSGDIFDSVSFKGVKIATDENMYPGNERGFAPVIRGNASSNAHITIHQNGYLVYQTNVAPGAFAINDLYPMYAGGDLTVAVNGADGSVQVFTVPYASTPTLLREGRMKYEASVGRFRSSSDRYNSPAFVQGGLTAGLPMGITAYGGTQLSSDYRALALGIGIDLGRFGALSGDITQADSTLTDGSQHRGQSLRFLWLHSLNSLGTSFQLTGYRYSTKGFHSLEETALKNMAGWRYSGGVDEQGKAIQQSISDYYNLNNSQRERFQLSLSQRLGESGSFYVSGVRETYWNLPDASESLQAGYNNSLGAVNYNLSYSHNRYAGFSGTDRTFYLSLNVPLSAFFSTGEREVYATFNSSRDASGNQSWQTGLSGSLLKENNLSWQLSQGQDSGRGNSANSSLSYQGTYGNGNIGYSYGRQSRQLTLGLSGGILAHQDGITFSQPLGDTNALVAAPGAADLSLGNGIRTDWRGYTVKSYLSPYQENRIALEADDIPEMLEIENAVQRVVPTKGAIVRAGFKTHTGQRAVMTLTWKNQLLPFGTAVTLEDGGTGIVGDDGQVYLSGLQPEGKLTAQWGNRADQRCSVNYVLPEAENSGKLLEFTGKCI